MERTHNAAEQFNTIQYNNKTYNTHKVDLLQSNLSHKTPSLLN